MGDSFGIEGVPDGFAEMYLVARDWWRDDDARLLPGEESWTTVFVVDFRDGCRYFGYTGESLVGRVASLMSDLGGFGSNPFILQHVARVPYVVRCVESGLDKRQAPTVAGHTGVGGAGGRDAEQWHHGRGGWLLVGGGFGGWRYAVLGAGRPADRRVEFGWFLSRGLLLRCNTQRSSM